MCKSRTSVVERPRCLHTDSLYGAETWRVRPFVPQFTLMYRSKGGLLILGDGVARKLFDNKKENIFPRFPPVSKGKDLWPQSGSWFLGWQDTWVRLACSNYQIVDSLLKHSSFSLISSQRYFCPVGWSGDDLDHGDELGEIMLTNSRVSLPVLMHAELLTRRLCRNSFPLARLR